MMIRGNNLIVNDMEGSEGDVIRGALPKLVLRDRDMNSYPSEHEKELSRLNGDQARKSLIISVGHRINQILTQQPVNTRNIYPSTACF
jgi:hypothetical protein